MNEAAIVHHNNALVDLAYKLGLRMAPQPNEGSFQLSPGEMALPNTPTAYFKTLAEVELYLRGYDQACKSYRGVCIVP